MTRSGSALLVAVLVAVGLGRSPVGADTSLEPPVDDPVPGLVATSGTAVRLEEVVTIPASGADPDARINYVTDPGDGSGRLFVPDLRGTMWVVTDGSPAVYLDVAASFADFTDEPRLGSGFGFVAFHPDFADNGLFYTVHTEDGAALAAAADYDHSSGNVVHGVITEWDAADPAAAAFAGTSREVLRIGFSTHIHGIQQIGFDPTLVPADSGYGLLYIAVGDGDETPVFTTGPQDLGVPYGKLLRIDPGADDGPNGEYGIPASNPFATTMGALGEIWAYGLRNPHRFSWDPVSSTMLIASLGENNIDAVYIGASAANYGWNEREGPFLFDPADPDNVYPLPPGDDGFGYTYPVAYYDHDDGFAIVGGFVSRDPSVPTLTGEYVFGDIVNGRLFHATEAEMSPGGPPAPISELTLLDSDDVEVTMQDLAGNQRVDLRLGTDSSGTIFVLSKANGRIWRIAAGPEPPPPPPPPDVECPGGGVPFTDVSVSSFAFGDVVCIFGLGITTGTSATTFSPFDFVTREQMAAFLGRLWRVSGRECPGGGVPFTDVSGSSFAFGDVVCIFGLGITTGTSATTFSPFDFVTREQMAAFLGRLIRAL